MPRSPNSSSSRPAAVVGASSRATSLRDGNLVVGLIPAYAEILNDGGLGIGFVGRVASISVVTELGFNPDRLDHYPLFGVRYVILPSVAEPRVPARLVRTEGIYSLFEVNGGGYLRVADSIGPPITADRATIGANTGSFVASNLPVQGVTRPIAFEGDPGARPTISVRDLSAAAAGSVLRETDRAHDGEFAGRVKMDRRALVVLAASYHGRWEATVDGEPVETQMVAPSFVAVEVPPGTHTVAFRYAPYPAVNYAAPLRRGDPGHRVARGARPTDTPTPARRCGDAEWQAPDDASRAIVVAPHPDDEVLGASGILTTRPCTVVFATDGVPPDVARRCAR